MTHIRQLYLGMAAALLALCACGEPATPSPPLCPVPAEAKESLAVVINEFMAANALTIVDEEGKASDWIELFNAGDAEVSLCGFGLTDDLDTPNKVYLGAEAVIAPRQYLLVWLSGDNGGSGPNHVSLRLPATGGAIGLSHPDGGFVSQLVFGEQATDLAAAREPDGSDLWVIEWHASPGASNVAGAGVALPPGQLATTPEQVPAAGDVSERIMGYDVMLELSLRIEPAQMDMLRVEPRAYVEGYLALDGREYGPVGIRLKGNNSFQPIDQKPSFRINVDEYVHNAKFFELDDLTLNNLDDDFSMMHERLAYLVARAIGPASRANHALITLNGTPYGLYSNVETVKRRMLARWFSDATGPLFEATNVDFSAPFIDFFDLESGPDDRSKLVAAAAALEATDPDAAIAAVSEHVHLESFLSFWAMEAVIGQFDAFPYSDPGDDYFVYADPETERLWFLPWGMDETFYAGADDVQAVVSLLARTCLASPGCQQAFIARVWSVLDITESMDLLQERIRVIDEIAPHVADDNRKPYSNAVVSEFQENLYWFLFERQLNLEAMLGPRPSP